MLFSSADYPVFLVAVCFLYGLLGAGRPLAAVARVALVLLLGDLVYLLLVKDVGRLWDPVGALAYRALAADAPPARPAWAYAIGLVVFGGAIAAGRRWGASLEQERPQRGIAGVSFWILVAIGAGVLAGWSGGWLDRMSEAFAARTHLVFLALLGLAVGAGMTEAGRRIGQIVVLFLVSAVFYHAWAAGMPGAYKYLLLLIVWTIVLDYWLAIWIERSEARWVRVGLLVFSLASNLGVLATFKYLDFFRSWFGAGPIGLILPAGISFHTFQSLSYTIDVYRRKIPATCSVLDFATFVLFFPQLVAGPIVRAHEFMPQLAAPPAIDPDRAAQGLFRIAIGLFKKLALADLLANALVDRAFARPELFSGVEVLFGVYGYAFQIYLDFSAYSDIAIGSAQLLGFTFPENFATPYRAANLQEFWRRWHITLSTWLRDYLYIPLGGSRGGAGRTYVNLTVTMLLGGLWHGANWTFIVWGALHGGGLAVTRVFQREEERDPRRARRMLVATLGVAAVGVGVHVGLLGGVRSPWFHLILGWLYLTPAWASLTAWLSAAPAPAAPGAHGSTRPVGMGRASLVARLSFLAVSVALLAAIHLRARWAWAPLLVSWLGLACLGDVFAAAPGRAAVRRYAVWALRRGAAMALTFHYVCFAWVFFRATSFEQARAVLAQVGGLATDAANLTAPFLMAIAVASAAHLFPGGTFRWVRDRFVALPPVGRAALLAAAALVLRRFATPDVVPFIYFQF